MFTKDQISEENYSNPRVIEIDIPEVTEAWHKLDALRKEVNEAVNTVNEKDAEYKKIQAEAVEVVKEKLGLHEFEDVRGLTVEEDKTSVTVIDVIEELIRKKRERNQIVEEVTEETKEEEGEKEEE